VGGTTFSELVALDQSQVALLTQAAIKSMEETRKILMKWRSQGHSLKDTYLFGITGSARLIGELWSRDALDFVNVTIALSRLHRVMHEFSQEFLSEGNAESNGLSLLLMTEPGSQHGLGVFMLSEFFRQAGWRVTLASPQDIVDFKRIFLSDWFDAVVLSISTDRQIDTVSKAVLELSKATINPKLKIYVGGPMAQVSPEAINWDGTLLLQTDAAQTVEIVTQNAFAPSQPEVAHPIKHFDSLDNLALVSKD
jgi:methanogenic corrinoid protein MtbC1